MAQLLTVKECSDRCRCSASTIYAAVADGRLRCYRIGAKGRRGHIRIDESDLDEFWRGCRDGGPTAEPPPPPPPPRLRYLTVE